MVCPFAKRAGPLVICNAVNRKVNPLVFPCFSDRYQTCRNYPREAKERAEAVEARPAAPGEPQEALGEKVEEPVAVSGREEAAETITEEAVEERAETPTTKRRGLGIRIDGRPAENCLECLYYGAQTGACLKLGVDVKDPHKPPCFEIEG